MSFKGSAILKSLVFRFWVHGSGFTVGRFALFIFLEIGDESTNSSSYAESATPQYLKTVQFSSVNLEP